MSTIEFDEQQNIGSFRSRKLLGDPMTPSFARFFIKLHVVKTEVQAKYLLLGLILFCLISSTLLWIQIIMPKITAKKYPVTPPQQYLIDLNLPKTHIDN